MFEVVLQLPVTLHFTSVVLSNEVKYRRTCFGFFCLLILIMMVAPFRVFSEEYESLETKNRIGIEVQYAESKAFETEALLTGTNAADYVSRYKYLDSFPKMKGSLKYTRYLESGATASVMYKYMTLFNAPDQVNIGSVDDTPAQADDDIIQHLVEGEVSKKYGDMLTLFLNAEVISDSRDFYTYKPGAGLKLDFSSITSVSGEASYFMRDDDAEELGGKITAINVILKLRQVLTSHTAMFLEYDTVITDIGEKNESGSADGSVDVEAGPVDSGVDVSNNFTSHTVSVQLSRYFDNQTALHGRLRYYDNTDIGVQSLAPSIRVDKYLGWATVLSGKYRYYINNNTNVEVLEDGATDGGDIIVDNDITSHTLSLQLKREVNEDLNMFARYRYYTNNFDVDMNVYSIGAELSF